MRTFSIGVFLLALLGASIADASRHRSHRESGPFDYYMLSLSWAPDFCARPDVQKNERECGADRHAAFVVHGLWPQSEEGRGPEQCAPASPVAAAIVQRMLNYIPSEGLIQHEWKTHGTCSGLPAAQYFDLVRRAFDSLTIPAEYKSLNRQIQVSPSEIESKFASTNPSFPAGAFRTSCGGGDLAEVRVCFSKDLKPRACTDSAGECRMGSTTMRPVR
jgi:ribonuclease T2